MIELGTSLVIIVVTLTACHPASLTALESQLPESADVGDTVLVDLAAGRSDLRSISVVCGGADLSELSESVGTNVAMSPSPTARSFLAAVVHTKKDGRVDVVQFGQGSFAVGASEWRLCPCLDKTEPPHFEVLLPHSAVIEV